MSKNDWGSLAKHELRSKALLLKLQLLITTDTLCKIYKRLVNQISVLRYSYKSLYLPVYFLCQKRYALYMSEA